MHGTGFISMGILMNTIADRNCKKKTTKQLFKRELMPLKDVYSRNEGEWDFDAGNTLKMSEVQNVPRRIQWLSSHLLGMYRELARKKQLFNLKPLALQVWRQNPSDIRLNRSVRSIN